MDDFGIMIKDILEATDNIVDQFDYERHHPMGDQSRLTLMMGLKIEQLDRAYRRFRSLYDEQTVEPERHSWQEWQEIKKAHAREDKHD